LLHTALREILGDHVKQAGSLVSPDRLRFDFSHFAQVHHEKLQEVETLVNDNIRQNIKVSTQEMAMEDALKTGAMAIFEERYGDKVRLVSVEGVSKELCGGTHSNRTGDIGFFTILSESAVGANLRRIEALTGKAAIEYSQKLHQELNDAAIRLKVSVDQINDKIDKTLKDLKEKDREIESLKAKLLSKESGDLLGGIEKINGIQVLAREIDSDTPKDLREYADRIRDRIQSGIVVLGAKNKDKVMLISLVTKDLLDRFKAGEIIRELSQMVGGKGGGRPDMAQGGGNRPEELAHALEAVSDIVRTKSE
jgi:alanyl-tRNA synthetase